MVLFRLIEIMGARAYQAVAQLDWKVFWMLTAAHMLVTYLGLRLAGEIHLMGISTFIYFYSTTASTIGYGDLSPATELGRVFVSVWLFPGALTFFTVLLAKVSQTSVAYWRKRMDGFGDYSAEKGKTVIIGLHPKATQRVIIDLLAGGLQPRDIILMTTKVPAFDTSELHYVRSEDLVAERDLRRAGVMHAKTVLVFAEEDDTTLTAAMAVSWLVPAARVVAALECDVKARLLGAHTKVVPVVSQSAEVVASEVLDPGISSFFTVLGSASQDVTAFRIQIDIKEITADMAYNAFRSLGMTFLGTIRPGFDTPYLNVPGDTDLTGRPLFYISAERVSPEALTDALRQQKTT
ncbi:potassium channel family protein [Sulfitobacter sp. 1A13353]|uniref:potassium channel family protein n=1 Tax=Sulfitobacter sp. 1A13353 TaxID=3368568 RepID=UPI0037474CC4